MISAEGFRWVLVFVGGLFFLVVAVGLLTRPCSCHDYRVVNVFHFNDTLTWGKEKKIRHKGDYDMYCSICAKCGKSHITVRINDVLVPLAERDTIYLINKHVHQLEPLEEEC